MTELNKAVNHIDTIYQRIDANLREQLESLLYAAAERGEFGVVVEDHPELFDQLRLANFFELPMGFSLYSRNDTPNSVESFLCWTVQSARKASLVNDLVQKSLAHFTESLNPEETMLFNSISQKLNQNDFYAETRVPFYDDEAAFIERKRQYFLANGFILRFGLGENAEIKGRAERKYGLLYVSVY